MLWANSFGRAWRGSPRSWWAAGPIWRSGRGAWSNGPACRRGRGCPDPGPTVSDVYLSPHWYRVRELRPALKDHIEVTRHRYQAGAWYVVHNLATGRVHRFTPAAWLFVGRLDGQRT